MANRTSLPPPGVVCLKCNNTCIIEGLKCDNCNGFIHVSCSDLPTYHLVNYFNSRIHFNCEKCVKLKFKDSYDEKYAWVQAIVERDNATAVTDLGEKDTNNVTTDLLEENSLDEGNVPKIPLSKDKVDKICYFYRQNICKHGREGKDCRYNHPKICPTYQAHGPDPILGCVKGRQCENYHPMICKRSLQTSECFNRSCRKLHLKGTRRRPQISKPGHTAVPPLGPAGLPIPSTVTASTVPRSASPSVTVPTTEPTVPASLSIPPAVICSTVPCFATAPVAAPTVNPIGVQIQSTGAAPTANQPVFPQAVPAGTPESLYPSPTVSPVQNRPHDGIENFLIKQVQILQMQMNHILKTKAWQQDQITNWHPSYVQMGYPQRAPPQNQMFPY